MTAKPFVFFLDYGVLTFFKNKNPGILTFGTLLEAFNLQLTSVSVYCIAARFCVKTTLFSLYILCCCTLFDYLSFDTK